MPFFRDCLECFCDLPDDLRRRQFLDSVILDDEDLQIKLQQLIFNSVGHFPHHQKWKLIYRGSRDGFKSRDRFYKCLKHRRWLTIIKTTNGNIFGGYTSSQRYVGKALDRKAFIFSLINQEQKPFVALFKNKDEHWSTDSWGNFGFFIKPENDNPIRSDFHIADNSNTNQYSYSDFGSSYYHQDYQEDTERAKTILAGSYNFQTVEIEVFAKIIKSYY